MDRTLTAVQADIDSTKNAKAQGNVEQWQHDLWDEQLAGFEKEKEALLEKEAKLEEHVQANGYILDTLKSGDYTMAELAHTPEDYTLQCIAVQKWALELQDAFDSKTASLESEVKLLNNDLLIAKDQAETDGFVIQQIELENKDLTKRLKNATDIIAEKDAEIERLKQQHPTGEVKEIAPLTAEEQDALWQAENAKLNNRIKVTNIRNADPTGIDTRISLATVALTQEQVEFPTIYAKGRYVEISEAEAEQLRADYANKKAEIQASIPSIPHVEPLVTPEIPALQEVHTHTPQESTNHDVHSGGIEATEGNQTVHELVQPAAEENLSEPIPHDEMLAKLYQAHNELKLSHADLTARVDRIEVHANIPKVA